MYPITEASASPSSELVSGPIPLASYRPAALSPFGAAVPLQQQDQPLALPMPAFSRQSSLYADSYSLPAPMSASSLEQPVYRGVAHAEPLALRGEHAMGWGLPDASERSAPKKMELAPFLPFAPLTKSVAAAGSSFEFAAQPCHIERFTSFYSSAAPAIILKSLRIAFQTLSGMKVEVQEEDKKGKFRGVCFTDDDDSLQFRVNVFLSGVGAPAAHLVEFQRRCGDSVTFFRMFQKSKQACAHIHTAPFESDVLPLPPLTGSRAEFCAPPLPPAFTAQQPTLGLDLPSVASLCAMVSSDRLETQREVGKCLASMSRTCDLFPSALPAPHSASVPAAATTSTPAAESASKAIWQAVIHILTSGDSECARMGATILRNCLQRGEQTLLGDYLQQDRRVVAHLLAQLQHTNHADMDQVELIEQRELRRQVAAVLKALMAHKGSSWLNALVPGAATTVQQF